MNFRTESSSKLNLSQLHQSGKVQLAFHGQINAEKAKMSLMVLWTQLTNKDYVLFRLITSRVINHSICSTQDTKVTSVSPNGGICCYGHVENY